MYMPDFPEESPHVARPLDAAAVHPLHFLLALETELADAAVEPRAALALAAPPSLKEE